VNPTSNSSHAGPARPSCTLDPGSCATERHADDMRPTARQPLRLIGHPLCLLPYQWRVVVGLPGDPAPHPNLDLTGARRPVALSRTA
jgi:hypothetical protein